MAETTSNPLNSITTIDDERIKGHSAGSCEGNPSDRERWGRREKAM
jgi:hypothetical protein